MSAGALIPIPWLRPISRDAALPEGHVYIGRDRGRRPDPTIFFKNSVHADVDLRKLLPELRAVFPMGSRAPAVQMASMRKDECGETDRARCRHRPAISSRNQSSTVDCAARMALSPPDTIAVSGPFVQHDSTSAKAVRRHCDKTHISLMMVLLYVRLNAFNF
ncbi:hypothetical protein [Rhizobium sp. BK251]|uniref:hypothetical protein n=1 Tax=Rhizobium sp. BK251 TaxID=2512125 RepID=UPI0010448A4B|nr:hypothetical protein [Rhizobium sp. BK251]